MHRLASIVLLLIALAAASQDGGRIARAEPTSLAVIACENIASYVDGNTDNPITPADYEAVCAAPLPATGDGESIALLANAIGDADGSLEPSDLADFDALDNNRIDPGCTYERIVVAETRSPVGCTLLAFTFVDDDEALFLDVPPALASFEGALDDSVCTDDGVGIGEDADCDTAVPGDGDGDGVVVFHLLTSGAAQDGAHTIGVQQEAVEHSAAINLSREPRRDTDIDADDVATTVDNCPLTQNAGQENTDSAPITTFGALSRDKSIAADDYFGDACDTDDDNDRHVDELETIGTCVGNQPTFPLVADTDRDLVGDGAECTLGSDPAVRASTPGLPGPGEDRDGDGLSNSFEGSILTDPDDPDTDGDGITDGVEYKGYSSSPLDSNTDGDTCSDGAEVASVNEDTVVDSLDLLIVAQGFFAADRPAHDIDKGGSIDSLDLQIVATRFDSIPC